MSAAPHPAGCGTAGLRPALEVATIFREHGEAYRQGHTLTREQLRAMRAIERCRTAALGGHLDACVSCGAVRPAYNSCRNRHCPKCQSLAQAKWLDERKRRILPTSYFHVVFTLPSELRAVARLNPGVVYGLLFHAAAQTLLELGRDPKRLGATLGVTCVLHTWSRTLAYHPHVHCIVTGGGLSLDQERWVASARRYLFPLPVMAALFRGKMLSGLRRAHRQGKLRLPTNLAASAWFDALVDRLFGADWVVYAKPPFGGPEHVYAYLGRYTHRVGLDNRRLRAIDDEQVRFVGRHRKLVTLTPGAFIGRFLQHVLPPDFVKLRHYGLLAASNATTLLEV
ncbi:MAG: IS91 family transposase, partial [Myxococcota bacterium]